MIKMKTLQYKSITQGLPPVLKETDVCSLDLELGGLREGQLHRPAGRMLSLACCFDGENVFIIFDEDEVQEFLNRIEKATWVFHNSVFDIGHLRRWATITERKNMRDTLLIERILWSNYYDDFSLKALVRRYLECYMPKAIRKELHNLEGAMTQEQIEYAALDVIGTWLVDKEQQKLVSPTDNAIWNNLYNPHVWTVLELGGLKLDVDMWRDLADKYQVIVDEIGEKLGKKYGKIKKRAKFHLRRPSIRIRFDPETDEELPMSVLEEQKMADYLASAYDEEYFEPLNLNSPLQIKAILFEKFGLDLESTDDDHIRPYYETNEFVNKLLDYRKAEKQVSTYGLSFLKNVEDDDRIYTSMNIGLAGTGRDSSSSPNAQNIPSSKERRACFIAGQGKKIVLYDYSGQEAGLWAFITGDEKFKEIINSGKKLYIEVARIAFDEIVQKGTERYGLIKALVLMLMYGGTSWGFSRDNGVDNDVADSMVKAFFAGFPTSAKWMKEQQRFNHGVSDTILGRRIHLHPHDSQWRNNALNNPMQGSGADMIKLAMRNLRRTLFYKQYYPDGRVSIILQVHDEIMSEVDEPLAQEWAEVMKKVMIDTAETLTPGIVGGVSGGVIDNWSLKD